MNRDVKSKNEADEITERLAPLARARAVVPPADAVYWRAQARLTVGEAARRRTIVMRPLRLFQRAIGVGAVGLGALFSLWPLQLSASPGAGLFAIPMLAALAALGAFLLAEARPRDLDAR